MIVATNRNFLKLNDTYEYDKDYTFVSINNGGKTTYSGPVTLKT